MVEWQPSLKVETQTSYNKERVFRTKKTWETKERLGIQIKTVIITERLKISVVNAYGQKLNIEQYWKKRILMLNIIVKPVIRNMLYVCIKLLELSKVLNMLWN